MAGMSTNTIAISRRLTEKGGLDKRAADELAEAIADFSDESHASKADLARVEGKVDILTVRINILTVLCAGTLLAILADKL